MKKLSLLFLLLTVFVFVGCSDDDKAPIVNEDDYSVVLTSDAGVVSISSTGSQDFSQAETSVNAFRGATQLTIATGTPTVGSYTVTLSEVSGGTASVSSNIITINSLTPSSIKVVVTLNINIENKITVARTYIAEVIADNAAQLVTNFEGKLTEANSEFKATGGTQIGTSEYYESSFNDSSNSLKFSHYYASWGFGGGFTYCNYTDVTTEGYKNISAITGKGKTGNTYLVSTTANPPKITLLKSEKYIFKGAWVTNSTYAYLAIKDGKDGYTEKTKFKADDWFKIIATGYDSNNKVIGTVDYYLADYRNGKNNIVNTWEWFDFSSISSSEYIIFKMESTDNDPTYGMNTPSYFCMDGITLEEK